MCSADCGDVWVGAGNYSDAAVEALGNGLGGASAEERYSVFLASLLDSLAGFLDAGVERGVRCAAVHAVGHVEVTGAAFGKGESGHGEHGLDVGDAAD